MLIGHLFFKIASNAVAPTRTMISGFTSFISLQINAYPNPSNEIIKIKGIEKLGVIYGINIQNSEGRILKKISTDYSEINISDLRSGIYFLNILHENGEGIIRIIKK